MATQQPARMEAMIVIGTELYYASNTRAICRSLTADNPAWNREEMRQHHVLGDEQIEALINQWQAFADDYDDMYFTPPHLATITAQTLIVQGDRDKYCPITFATEMYSSIPNSYLWIFPNGPHVPILGENAAFFIKTALAFLRGDWVSV
jgi:pimeloyl-ACP methyl ester carboxylesterase